MILSNAQARKLFRQLEKTKSKPVAPVKAMPPTDLTHALITTPTGFEFLIVPVAKPRQTRRDKWLKRPCVVRYRAYKDALTILAKKAGYTLGDTVQITFVLPMPESWPEKKRRDMAGKAHQAKPDIDNLLKAFMDALSKNDSYVHSLKDCSKVWGEKGKIIVGTFF